MKKATAILLPFAALAMAASGAASPALAAAGDHPAPRAASIPFVNHGNVDDWRADGTRAVYFRDGRNWYRATLFSPAFDLPYAQNIGIDAGPGGSLDKWGAIYVRGQRYTFQSFEKVAGPPAKHHKA